MSALRSIALERIMPPRLGTVNPSAFPDEEFDLYSIPAFDKGEPDVLQGSAIGSAKQIVQPGDVLLSRIVPHIRRAWIVGVDRGRRIIASGEWIVFRGQDVDQRYLRHVLVSDPFHAEFMRTVSGVGGSLLRARPGYVAKITIPLPLLPEQRLIAEILDKADALRTKRRAALAQLDTLTQSIFLEMFGDPGTNPKGWPVVSLESRCTLAGQYGANVASKEFDPTLPRYVRITDVTEEGALNDQPASPAGNSSDWQAYNLAPGDLLFARSGATVGKTYIHRNSHGRCVFAGYMIRFRPDRRELLPEYLFAFTRSAAYRAWVAVRQRVVAQPNINAKQYGNELLIPLPPINSQEEFAARMADIERMKSSMHTSRVELDALFSALQHAAFRGSL
jgi:type I restriction enzyme S subunit